MPPSKKPGTSGEKTAITPKAKAATKARPVAPSDDPVAAVSAMCKPAYDFAFDVAGLVEAVDAGPTVHAAAEVFASEVSANMQQDSALRIKQLDPTFLAAIIQVVLAIVEGCPEAKVTQALTVAKERPRGLAARFMRLNLARRLPGHWLHDALEASRAMIDTGIKNMDTDLFVALFPPSVANPAAEVDVVAPGCPDPYDSGPASPDDPEGMAAVAVAGNVNPT